MTQQPEAVQSGCSAHANSQAKILRCHVRHKRQLCASRDGRQQPFSRIERHVAAGAILRIPKQVPHELVVRNPDGETGQALNDRRKYGVSLQAGRKVHGKRMVRVGQNVISNRHVHVVQWQDAVPRP